MILAKAELAELRLSDRRVTVLNVPPISSNGGCRDAKFCVSTSVSPTNIDRPFYQGIAAGFPSPADDHHEGVLDIHDYVVKNPSATFFMRVEGLSMTGAGIYPDDVLVVDRSVPPRDGCIVIAVLNREFTVKRLYRRGKTIKLLPENSDFRPIEIVEGDEFSVWGVVTCVLHKTL